MALSEMAERSRSAAKLAIPDLGRSTRAKPKSRTGGGVAAGEAIKILSKKVAKSRAVKAANHAVVPPNKK